MPGLDQTIINTIDYEKTIKHIILDIRSDFILAPHYNSIFMSSGDELWSRLRTLLQAGTYSPELPLTVSVPKERWFTRPGSILQPFDRFLYQALIDSVADILEKNMDRNRSFSHVVSQNPEEMVLPTHQCWAKFQEKVAGICKEGSHVVKADISNYFERIPQHHLTNLMSATGCPSTVVKLLEEMLLAFQERDSFGIVQGLFPSDILGNFFLSHFDAFCELKAIPFARYVDDIYLSFKSSFAAKKGLIGLTESLRKDSLHLNEYKSGIFSADQVIKDETAIDRLFQEVRDEVDDESASILVSSYAFEADWEFDENKNGVISKEKDIESVAMERLFRQINNYPQYEDRIEKFCLPLLRAAESDVAVDHVLKHLFSKPHRIRLYFSYISTFVAGDPWLVLELQEYFRHEELISDYQKMFLLGSVDKG